jgi:hypothetical protein
LTIEIDYTCAGGAGAAPYRGGGVLPEEGGRQLQPLAAQGGEHGNGQTPRQPTKTPRAQLTETPRAQLTETPRPDRCGQGGAPPTRWERTYPTFSQPGLSKAEAIGMYWDLYRERVQALQR